MRVCTLNKVEVNQTLLTISQPGTVKATKMAFILDRSGSMTTEVSRGTTRFKRVCEIMDMVMDFVKRNEMEQPLVISFSSIAGITDLDTFKRQGPSGNTSFNKALTAFRDA